MCAAGQHFLLVHLSKNAIEPSCSDALKESAGLWKLQSASTHVCKDAALKGGLGRLVSAHAQRGDCGRGLLGFFKIV